MSLSKQHRDGDMVRALALMLEQLGDAYTDSAQGVFDMADHRFGGILRSTWADMEDLGYIRRDDQITGKATPEYLFTPVGWYAAQNRLGGKQKNSEFVSKLARLSRALKGCIKAANRAETLEDARTIAAGADVSYNFVCNAIDSAAIENYFGRQGARWNGRAGDYIFIPANFGHK